MAINMRREALSHLEDCQHAGLLLERYFNEKNDSGEKHNNAVVDFHKTAADITENHSQLYEKAFEEWKQYHVQHGKESQLWFGKLLGRMFLGMGEVSPLEAGITLHHTYGVPFIPGSAVKGVLHHYAQEAGISEDKEAGISEDIQHILFGKSANGKDDIGDAGYIIFNDAWWIPEGKGLAPEIITVHAQKYYRSEGKDTTHPDFESPNPNPQVAIQGSFMFSVEGDEKWAEYAIKLLAQVMENKGVGGKVASGYGYFEETKAPLDKQAKAAQSFLDNILTKVKKEHNIPADNQAYASKPMAEEWVKIEDAASKQGVLELLNIRWDEGGRKPSKKAQKVYDENMLDEQ